MAQHNVVQHTILCRSAIWYIRSIMLCYRISMSRKLQRKIPIRWLFGICMHTRSYNQHFFHFTWISFVCIYVFMHARIHEMRIICASLSYLNLYHCHKAVVAAIAATTATANCVYYSLGLFLLICSNIGWL